MALSGMITFGLIVVLIDNLNGQITYPEPVMIKAKSKAALIRCQMNSAMHTSNAIHWYSLKDQAVKRLMYVEAGSKTLKKDENDNRKISGSVSVADKVTLTLTISKLELSDDGYYYCAYWSGDKKEFGTGTRLYVTERGNDQIKPPKLSGYLPSKKDNHGRQTMLCQARGMFPNLVKFEWKKKDGGQWNDPGGNTVEQNNEGSEVTVTSMLIMDKDKVKNDDYRCTVTHEGKSQNLDIKIENSKPAEESKPDKADVRTSYIGCPTSSNKEPNIMQISGDSEQIPSMSLFVYAYGVMLVKNGLFFCIVSIFLLQRNAGKKDKKSSET
ncbi:immunoglobulin kappa light chain isoform X1 [Carassius auratus]|uniref:immunoglobulin kappa light chain isoform X1 n=1 Tax=Carassius auratus TaxID=7957 RepID=UPI000E42563F|nr:immunoglobulin kappa light chain-like isoform X1 [Carassius auratus]